MVLGGGKEPIILAPFHPTASGIINLIIDCYYNAIINAISSLIMELLIIVSVDAICVGPLGPHLSNQAYLGPLN